MDKLGAKKGKNIEEKKDKNRTKLENGFLLIKHSIIAESRIIRKKNPHGQLILDGIIYL